MEENIENNIFKYHEQYWVTDLQCLYLYWLLYPQLPFELILIHTWKQKNKVVLEKQTKVICIVMDSYI